MAIGLERELGRDRLMLEYANKHPVAFVLLVVAGLYAGMYGLAMWRASKLVPAQETADGSRGVATGEPYSPVTALPSSWGNPVAVAAGGGGATGALESGGVPPWDRQYS